MNSRQIRQQFLDFFASKGHEIVDSSPVVPLDDPTLMFTNAGMNQFKDVFLGTGSRPYTRVADTQKCIRAGGKHNDLDDVGQDTYHHTFFEMLGNWSFGDYFKKEAIEWAWELLTEVWGIDKGRLHATYFEGDESEGLEPDTESAELWKSVTDIDPSQVHPGGKKDNFWEMGDTGPCGPCSEVHIDLTPDKSGHRLVNAGDPRVIELWNLVFIQFNRDAEGKLTPLPARHVDTGMGFERLAAVLGGMEQGRVDAVSNYDTDVWTPIFEAIQKRTGAPAYRGTLPSDPSRDQQVEYSSEPQASACADSGLAEESTRYGSPRGLKPAAQGGTPVSNRREITREQVMIDVSYRVIADHVRCLTFALTDGGIPSNEGRGYVLRRILRRAVRYGRQYMNMHEPFMCDLVISVAEHMAAVFPELRTSRGGKNVEHITELIRDEEASFLRTIDRGLAKFDDAVIDAVVAEIARNRGWSWQTSTTSKAFFVGDDQEAAPPSKRWRLRFRDSAQTAQNVEVDTANLDSARHLFAKAPVISGRHAFRLNDTYGFPIDLTLQIAEERGLQVDVEGFESLMRNAQEEARAAARGARRGAIYEHELSRDMLHERCGETVFVGHEALEIDTYVAGIIKGDNLSQFSLTLQEGEEGAVVLLATPFYAEKGGQVADDGIIRSVSGLFEVYDTQEIDGVVVHHGKCVQGILTEHNPDFARSLDDEQGADLAHFGIPAAYIDPVRAVVAERSRFPTMKNHTSTHMLNWALREVLGDHVQQKGSLVDPEKTRYDFSHNKPLTDEEVVRVEQLVNELIEKDLPVYVEEIALEKARKIKTVRAVFGEKYADPVRVVSVGADIQAMIDKPDDPEWMECSVELCGGTHLKRSSEAERFVLILEEGVAKGVRRLVGITGETARQAEEAGQSLLAEVQALADKPPVALGQALADKPPVATGQALADKPPVAPVPVAPVAGQVVPDAAELASRLTSFHQRVNEATIPVRVRRELQDRIGALQKSLKEQQKRAASVTSDAVMGRVSTLLESAEEVAGVKIVVGGVPAARPEALRSAIDWVRNKTEASAVLLATVADDNVTLIAGMSKAVVDKGVSAGDLIREIAPLIGGRGGGRPDMAQGGGNDLAGIPNALDRAKTWLVEKL